MNTKYLKALALMILATLYMHDAFAGWNHITRSKCSIFKKYWVEAHAGYTSSSGGSISPSSDSGCSYAHAGPVRSYAYDSFLLAEAEGYAGNSGLWGYAHAWNHWDPIVGLWKHGIAGGVTNNIQLTSQDITLANLTQDTNNTLQSASNHFYSSGVHFHYPAQRRNKTAYITVKGITGHLIATRGYSVFEIIAWKPVDDLLKQIPDTEITSDKIVWRGRAVVHDNQLSVEGELSKTLFTEETPTTPSHETIYSIRNIDIKIPLPTGTNPDDLAITIKGDAGDESVLVQDPKQ